MRNDATAIREITKIGGEQQVLLVAQRRLGFGPILPSFCFAPFPPAPPLAISRSLLPGRLSLGPFPPATPISRSKMLTFSFFFFFCCDPPSPAGRSGRAAVILRGIAAFLAARTDDATSRAAPVSRSSSSSRIAILRRFSRRERPENGVRLGCGDVASA